MVSVPAARQTLPSQGGEQQVPPQLLEALAPIRRRAHRRMDVEALDRGLHGLALPDLLRRRPSSHAAQGQAPPVAKRRTAQRRRALEALKWPRLLPIPRRLLADEA